MRQARADDYPRVAAALGNWMPPERVALLLPPGTLANFAETSLVATDEDGEVVGFLIAAAPAGAAIGYVHFVWVSPELRRGGLGRQLYMHAMERLRERGCQLVEAVTSSRNRAAVVFHEHLGFIEAPADQTPSVADLPVGGTAVVLTRPI